MYKTPITVQHNVLVQEIDQEILIYNLETNKAFCLNETSAMVWQLCDGKNSVADITKLVGRKLSLPPDEEIVRLALEQLKKEKLILSDRNTFLNLEGVSRREVIKKIGMTSMIALPVISSLVAPRPINAQSAACDSTTNACTASTGRPNNCCCQSGPQCQSGNCVGVGGGLKACRP